MTYDPSTQDNLFFTKLEDWKYEKEWRVVTNLASLEHIKNKNLYIKYINKEIISNIIFGWNIDNTLAKSVQKELKIINPSISIKYAYLLNGSVLLKEYN